MTIDDLKYIFATQISEGTSSLYYILKDCGHNTLPMLNRQSVDEMESLVPMLDCFEYSGEWGRIPRFVK